MKIISSPLELKEYLKGENNSIGFQGSKSIGFVPTMGALHQGHISLIKKAKEQNELVVVSIFLNPTQFLKGEDLDKYPKKDEADKKICKLSGVDVLFFPHVEDIYGTDEVTLSAPNVRGYVLEGNSRPSHFNGVLTVVMKLLNIVTPTRAYFGKKDAQQLNLISLMVKQLFMNTQIVPVDTVRESDGLALSSRNVYLSSKERVEALKVSSSLRAASSMVGKNILDSKEIVKEMRKSLGDLEIFYVEVLNLDFEQLLHVEIGNTIILVEVRVGTTRLLDNIWL
ncbi:pantoate--beta-alanine ligase [Candidatus Sulfurimonas marisnigri]|uniref:Pantothenate synthetase n=1 Tax=Candidatus Sulfurimonas marisnigri TaxID=2740405 RepID=A0A7S7M0S2_9BACT|nr:pantoate--beta-alanine ligase [Candidatus Sulfurimonas marisnigri]QOY54961.1 pantoate--beta-alanine ligase [Candidatus Sulfurimonas marisnigri]